MNWYKKAQTIYRGDPNPINMKDFDVDYGVRELGKQLGSSLAEGPGIYFSTNKDNALSYGENITKIDLNNANILSKKSKRLTTKQIENILKGINRETLEGASQNWNENFNIGKKILINQIANHDNPVDQLIDIWAEVYYRQNPNDFINLMARNGIDGIVIDRAGDTKHYIIYNRSILI